MKGVSVSFHEPDPHCLNAGLLEFIYYYNPKKRYKVCYSCFITGNKRGILEEKQISIAKYRYSLKEDPWTVKLDEAVEEVDKSFQDNKVSVKSYA